MMKKIFLFVILTISITSIMFSQTATPPSSGNGTSGSPYQIATLNNLYWITQNSGSWGSYFIQTADINASASSGWAGGGWTPIGNETTKFTGNYDGQGYVITGITISRTTTNYQGLFGYTNGATISNVRLVSLSISGQDYVGGLVGRVSGGTIQECKAEGTISGQDYIGGLLGSKNDAGGGTLSKSFSAGSVTGRHYVGGLVGSIVNSSTNANCYTRANVNSTLDGSTNGLGGIVGSIESSTLSNSYAANVIADAYCGETIKIGGIYGYFYNFTDDGGLYFDLQTSGFYGNDDCDDPYPTESRLTAQMKTDLFGSPSAIWARDASINDGYPYLQWQLPAITTTAATSITTSSAASGGDITNQGENAVTARGVCWSTSTGPTTADSKTTNGSGVGTFASSITGLSAQTQYFVRAYATNTTGTGYGNEVNFWTYSNPPTAEVTNFAAAATTNLQIDLTWTTATFPGSGATVKNYLLIRAEGGNSPVFTSTNGQVPTVDGNTTIVNQTIAEGTTSYNDAAGLTQGVQYNYLIIPFTWDGTHPETYNYLTASAPTASATAINTPTVTTQAVDNIATTSATGNGNITNLGYPNPTAHGVVYNTSTNPTTANSVVNNGAASATGAYTASITGLTPNTQYYVKAYATNTAGTVYGSEENFWTLANAPLAPTVNGATTTSLNVSINANGNPVGTEFAIQETGGNYVQADGSLNTGAVWQTAATWGTKTVTGLSVNTQYTFQVKARNGASTPVETAFSGRTSLYTLANAPVQPTLVSRDKTTIDLQLNANGNPVGTEFAIQETGSGNYVQADGSLNTGAVWQDEATWESGGNLQINGLTPGAAYIISVKARNGNDVETAGTAVLTIKTVPNEATNVQLTNILSDSFDISWTRGTGDGVKVFVKQTTSGAAAPADETNYTANSVFESGAQIGTSGWYCVYSGTGTSVTVTGLNTLNPYAVHVVEYVTMSGNNYYNSNSASNNPYISGVGETWVSSSYGAGTPGWGVHILMI